MYITTLSIIIVAVLSAIVFHYFCLVLLGNLSSVLKIAEKPKIAVLVIGALFANFTEIAIFGIASYLLAELSYGTLMYGNEIATLSEHIYFSMTNFSTLGMGDVIPSGQIRFLAGVESIVGMVLVTWTASFLYAEMQQHWTVE